MLQSQPKSSLKHSSAERPADKKPPPLYRLLNRVFSVKEIKSAITALGAGLVYLQFLKSLFIILILALLFYRSLIAAVFLIPAALMLSSNFIKEQQKRRTELAERQFCDAMYAFASALQAGFSAENALNAATEEIIKIHGAHHPMAQSFQRMLKKAELKMNIETVFKDFSEDFDSADIKSFAQVFSLARRTGGNLIEIVTNTAEVISRRQALREEITTYLSARHLEQNIMTAILPAIILYLQVTSYSYFGMMYETWIGRIIMTVCLLLYFAAFLLAKKIGEIEI